jgi:hypothetical protein
MSKTKTNFELVLIESSKRASGISTQFNFKLPKPCRDVYQIDLLYASLNNTFYTFTVMDTFNWIESFLPRLMPVIIPAYDETVTTYDDIDFMKLNPITTIVHHPERTEQQMKSPPDIPYVFNFQNSSLSVDEFIAYIKTNMNRLSASKNYQVSYDPSNFKLRISNTDTTNKKFSLDFTPDTSIIKKAGFAKKLYDPTNSIQSDSSMSLNSSEFVLVNINRFGCGISSKMGTGTFFLPSQSNRGDLIQFNQNTNFEQSVYTGNLDLSELQIQILDDNGSLLGSESEINLKLLLKCYKFIQM